MNGRKGVGIELKPSYFRQAVKNLEDVVAGRQAAAIEEADLFAAVES